ncbi:hypothetical protein EPO15_10895 [bacterium]|nr:MAG: hypothetical protein EPO15_10895 [bacterium]
MKQLTAALLSASLVVLSPGLPAGQAVAQVIAPRVQSGAAVTVAPVPAGVGNFRPSAALTPAFSPTLSLPSALPTAPSLTPTVRVNQPVAAAAAQAAEGVTVKAVLAVPSVLPAAVRAEAAPTAKTVSAMTQQAAASIEAAGPLAEAAPSDAHALGGRLESLLGGWRQTGSAAAAVAPEDNGWGAGSSRDRYFGKPAGSESIAGAVRSHNARFGAAEAPTPEPEPAAEAPRSTRSPFLPKLISAALAFLPAVALGLPLIAAGSTLAGGAILAASVALMTLPFMSERTPALFRAVPGAAILGLGVLTVVSGFMGGASLWMGGFVALGGWGLIRYGLDTEQKDRYDRDKALTAYFGALGAVLGAGLSLSGAAMLLPAWAAVVPFMASTWVVNGATWAAYPLTALLFLHLPGWVGEGISAAFRGVYNSGKAVYRVMGSLKRDTVLQERLVAFTKAHLKSSMWNAIWLSGIWIPVWVSEAAMFALSVVGGLALGAALAPTMFLWGASHKLWETSALTRFLAAWNHFAFDWSAASKIRVYNPLVKPLISFVNTHHGVASVAGSFALRLAQLAWFAYSVLSFPVTWSVGFFRAFGQTGGAYEHAKHSPDGMRVDTKDTPDVERPDEPADPSRPGKSTVMPRLIAGAIAALPLYFLAVPLLTAPVVGQLFAATGLALAVMPFLPAGSPKLVKMLPGLLLAALGVSTAAAVPYFLLNGAGLVGLLSQNVFWMGLVTALSGWGMARYAKNLETKEGQKWYSVDDPEYIGAFFGALGVTTGLGVALLGMTGWAPLAFKVAGYATSLLLLVHLPSWVGSGLRTAAEGGWSSMRAFEKVLSFWERDTDFYRNLRKHASYWLDKSVWNGSWLSVIWVPTWALLAAEWAVSLVFGAVAGLARLPLNFAWGAAYKMNPDSKLTRFIAGVARTSFEMAEGSKKTVFDPLVARLIPAMNEANPVSGRPTLKAAAAFLLARLAQALWLARLALWSPVIAFMSLLAGFKNAAGDKKEPGEGDEYKPDADNPGHTY